MGLTNIIAIVNMLDSSLTLINHELPAEGVITRVTPAGQSIVGTHWNVPWCTSAAEFTVHHLTMRYSHEGRRHEVAIWQERRSDGDFVRFTSGFTDGSARYRPDARRLAADANGTDFRVSGDHSVLLTVQVINGDVWVILYRV
jgi:hypothetical protein